MKGSMTIDGTPMRFGGVFYKNYYWDVEEWEKEGRLHEKRCYACGGVLRNTRINGTLLAHNFPYIASYKFSKGKHKGLYRFHLLCRACAYNYGLGVIEKDGEKYENYYDFKEEWIPPEERPKEE